MKKPKEKQTPKSEKVQKISKKQLELIKSTFGADSKEFKALEVKLQSSGLVAGAGGGGASNDTETMKQLRKSVSEFSELHGDGVGINKHGNEEHYFVNSNGEKVYPMVYFRKESKYTPKS